MRKTKINKKMFLALTFQIAIYILLFVLFPIFPQYIRPSSSIYNNLIISSTSALVSIVGIIFFVDKVRFWFMTTPILWLLIVLYHPKHIFGLGWSSDTLNFDNWPVSWEAFSITLWIFIIQCVLCWGKWGITKVIKHIKK